MSGTDKTGEMLVASIRRTKAGAQAGAAAKPKAGTAAAGTRKARPKTGAAAKQESTKGGTYQFGRRVWPD